MTALAQEVAGGVIGLRALAKKLGLSVAYVRQLLAHPSFATELERLAPMVSWTVRSFEQRLEDAAEDALDVLIHHMHYGSKDSIQVAAASKLLNARQTAKGSSRFHSNPSVVLPPEVVHLLVETHTQTQQRAPRDIADQ